MPKLKIYPSIDLLQGQSVRLTQGQFETAVFYESDPLAVAQKYEQAGAEYLHVVDLDGAKAQRPLQIATVERLLKGTKLKIQVGGGIRTLQDAQDYRNLGIERVVLGSLALKNPQVTRTIIDSIGAAHVTLAFDFARDSEGGLWPCSHAWTALERQTARSLFAIYQEYADLEYLCTDIERDGSLAGISASFYSQLREQAPQAQIIASGGIGGLGDIALSRSLGLTAAIIGKALYEGRFTLCEALQC